MASVKTVKGREKLAKAHAGVAALPKITKIALGSGGTNADGSVKGLTGNETTLFNKRVEKVAVLTSLSATSYRYSITVDADADSLVGVNINEACLIDEAGDLVAIKTFTNKGMESGVVITFDYDAEY